MTTVVPEPGYTLTVVWFSPDHGGERRVLTDVATLRRVLAPHIHDERLVIRLERDGDRGSVDVHITADRALVMHSTQVGGEFSCRWDASYDGPDETIGFLMDNKQLDQVHRGWAVPRGEGMQALEYFLRHGERDPSLSWSVDDGGTLADPPPGRRGSG